MDSIERDERRSRIKSEYRSTTAEPSLQINDELGRLTAHPEYVGWIEDNLMDLRIMYNDLRTLHEENVMARNFIEDGLRQCIDHLAQEEDFENISAKGRGFKQANPGREALLEQYREAYGSRKETVSERFNRLPETEKIDTLFKALEVTREHSSGDMEAIAIVMGIEELLEAGE